VTGEPTPEGWSPEPPPSSPGPLPPSLTRRLATGFYLLLLVAGAVWNRLRTGVWLPESTLGGDVGTSLALGAGAAAVVLLLSGVLLRRAGVFRELALEFRGMLGPIGLGTACVLALTSGVAEEFFFRGVMQPAVGYVITSVVFGVIHTGPDHRYLAWSVFAVVLGFALGGILEETGSLAGPVLAHASINLVNLSRIGRLPGAG